MPRKSRALPPSPFRRFNSSPEVIRLVVLMYVRFPLSLRNVEDLLIERGIDICHETVRFWWNRFGPMFAADIRRQRVSRMRGFRHWKWHLDEVYVKINGGSCQSDANSSPPDAALQRRLASGGKALPLGQRGRAEGLVGLAVDEVALGLKMVGDRGVDRSKLL